MYCKKNYCVTYVKLIIILQEKNMMFRKDWGDQDTAVEGKACSVILTTIFIGDILAFICTGPSIALFGTTNAVMMLTCVIAAVGLFCSSFISYPEKT